MQPFEREIKKLRRTRRWLIITGVPLAMGSLALAVFMAPLAAVLACAGMFTAVRTLDLIVTREPSLGD